MPPAQDCPRLPNIPCLVLEDMVLVDGQAAELSNLPSLLAADCLEAPTWKAYAQDSTPVRQA